VGGGVDCGDHEAVDCCGWGAREGGLEAADDVLEGRAGAGEGEGDVVCFGIGRDREAFG